MALVAYDSSDCSDSEDDDLQERRPNVESKSTLPSKIEVETTEISPTLSSESENVRQSLLFARLPPPRSHLEQITIPETDVDVSPVRYQNVNKWGQTKESKPVKIVIPSLSELVEDEEPQIKKPRTSTGKGLFSVLPPPKHSTVKVTNRPLIPYSVKPKNSPPKVLPKKSSSKELCKNSLLDSSKNAPSANDSDEDDLGETLDFFSLESVGKIPDSVATCSGIEEPSEPIESTYEPVSTNVTESREHQAYGDPNLVYETPNFEASSSAGSTSIDMSSLMSDEGFLRLGGTKKRGQQDIQFIDVAQADQLPSPEEWKRKALMEKTGYRPSRKKGFMPTAQQRRKHQITYLAFQAKEREMELQEQWAQNRFTKHQTQSKYGF